MAGPNTQSNVTGKQGLGFDMLVDGQSLVYDLGMEIQNPGSFSNEVNYLDATTTKSVGVKPQQPEELSEPNVRTITCFYDAGSEAAFNFLSENARKTLKYVEEIHPLHSGRGAHNGGIRGQAYVVASTIDNPIDGLQTIQITVSYQTARDSDKLRQNDYTVPTTITPSDQITAAVLEDAQVACLAVDGDVPFVLFRTTTGDNPGTDDADNAKFYIRNNVVYAAEDLPAATYDFFVGAITYDGFDDAEGLPVKADFDAGLAIQITIV